MNETQFHITLGIDPQFFGVPLAEKIKAEGSQKGLLIQVEAEPSKWSNEYRGFNGPHSDRGLFTIELLPLVFHEPSDNAIREAIAEQIYKWLAFFNERINKGELVFSKVLEIFKLKPVGVYCLFHANKLHFTFDSFVNKEQFLHQWDKMLNLISLVNSNDQTTADWLDTIARQKNNMSFLQYDANQQTWVLINRLLDAAAKLSANYRSQLDDPRLGKPHLIFNEDNYNEYTYFDKQWRLNIEDRPIIMPQPNDISMYVRLAEKSLKSARTFYDEEYANKSRPIYLAMLMPEEILKYYDYFETMFAAIIFSYSSIEALANICIPWDFQFRKPNSSSKKFRSKADIERFFGLRDKLIQVLPQTIQAPDPQQEEWWKDFEDLEEIRNEIIHTKQSKSEERYSLLLSKRIFDLVEVNRKIIQFYGTYINLHARQLLIDFPYDFGADSVQAAFMSDKDFRDYYKKLHNPSPGIDGRIS